MNERLEQLKKQAVDHAEKVFEYHGKDYREIVMEKFAELIVKECADICNKIYFDRYPDAEDWERSEEGDAIKKHFGVEE